MHGLTGTHVMISCRILALAAVAAVALSAPARAEDNWTALYWGFNGGYAVGDSDWDFGGGATTNPDLEGELYGLHAGYMHQFDSIVLGFETSYDWANLDGATACPNPLASCQNSLNQIATAGLRLGIAADTALIYATGGYAYASVESRVYLAGPGDEAADEWHGGWYAGAGIDYLLNRDVMLGVEYLYVDLEDQDHGLTQINTGAFVETANIDPQNHVIRIRLAAKVVGLFDD